jgi:hypothetical protein
LAGLANATAALHRAAPRITFFIAPPCCHDQSGFRRATLFGSNCTVDLSP